MAQTWVPTWRKRLMLAMLDAIVKVVPSLSNRGADSGKRKATDIRNILVLELWNIGDVVLATPFLSQLRSLFPAARISLLGRSHARTILEGTGLVDEVIETDLGWTEKATRFNPLAYRWRELGRLRRELRRRDFDVAFKARAHVREHLLLALSGARRRVAFALGHGNGVLTDPIAVADPNLQKSVDWLRLLEPFGGALPSSQPARLKLSESEKQWATEFLHAHGISGGARLVGVHPGASVLEKRWPLERFEAVAHSLVQRDAVKVLSFIDPAGYGLAINHTDVVSVRVSLRHMMALIERCSLLVCNDSGPMHIAGGLGVPTVAVFGSGVASWFAPLGEGHKLIATKNGHHFDVRDISVEQVLAAVDLALGKDASRG